MLCNSYVSPIRAEAHAEDPRQVFRFLQLLPGPDEPAPRPLHASRATQRAGFARAGVGAQGAWAEQGGSRARSCWRYWVLCRFVQGFRGAVDGVLSKCFCGRGSRGRVRCTSLCRARGLLGRTRQDSAARLESLVPHDYTSRSVLRATAEARRVLGSRSDVEVRRRGGGIGEPTCGLGSSATDGLPFATCLQE